MGLPTTQLQNDFSQQENSKNKKTPDFTFLPKSVVCASLRTDPASCVIGRSVFVSNPKDVVLDNSTAVINGQLNTTVVQRPELAYTRGYIPLNHMLQPDTTGRCIREPKVRDIVMLPPITASCWSRYYDPE